MSTAWRGLWDSFYIVLERGARAESLPFFAALPPAGDFDPATVALPGIYYCVELTLPRCETPGRRFQPPQRRISGWCDLAVRPAGGNFNCTVLTSEICDLGLV